MNGDPRLKMAQRLLLGGIVPVLAFAAVESVLGTPAGVIAGMAAAAGELRTLE